MRLNQLRFDWKPVAVIVATTLILCVDHYHQVSNDFRLNELFFYLALPLFVILVILRESPAEYGFHLGDWRAGLALTVVGIVGISLVLPFVIKMKEFREFYSSSAKQILPILFNRSVELIGWEFFFRGFLLFALYRIAGPYAIILQAVPFTLVHFGAPQVEVLSCIFGGSAFGYVAWRTDSFLYPFLIHVYLATLVMSLA
jgi:membrane protease YdiL (CAAX protease family)